MSDEGNKQFGQRGEDLALKFLKEKGFRWIVSNFKTKWGEIDLVMQAGSTLVFVEVKRRKDGQYGEPEEAITVKKKNHMVKSALHYLQKSGKEDSAVRFDVVSVGPFGIRHYEEAFQLEGDWHC